MLNKVGEGGKKRILNKRGVPSVRKYREGVFEGQKQPPEVFHKKGVLENFSKFTGKHLRESLF